MDTWEGSQLNRAKEILAYELTALVHGEEEAKKAESGAKAMFAGAEDAEHMPTTELTDEDFTDGQHRPDHPAAESGAGRNQKRRPPCDRTGRRYSGRRKDYRYQIPGEEREHSAGGFRAEKRQKEI